MTLPDSGFLVSTGNTHAKNGYFTRSVQNTWQNSVWISGTYEEVSGPPFAFRIDITLECWSAGVLLSCFGIMCQGFTTSCSFVYLGGHGQFPSDDTKLKAIMYSLISAIYQLCCCPVISWVLIYLHITSTAEPCPFLIIQQQQTYVSILLIKALVCSTNLSI